MPVDADDSFTFCQLLSGEIPLWGIGQTVCRTLESISHISLWASGRLKRKPLVALPWLPGQRTTILRVTWSGKKKKKKSEIISIILVLYPKFLPREELKVKCLLCHVRQIHMQFPFG